MTLDQHSTLVLQRAAAAAMRAYLDHDAGRGTLPLRRLLTSQAADALDEHQPTARPDIASTHAAIGPYAVLRLDQERAYVCAGVLHPGGEATVLAAELVERDGQLQVSRIGRAAEATASDATREPGPVGDGQPPPEPPPHMRSLIGEFPGSQDARERWLLGAAIIDTYRERHAVHDEALALGEQPESAEQRLERDRAVEYLRALGRDIDRLEPDRAAEPPARDNGREQGLGR